MRQVLKGEILLSFGIQMKTGMEAEEESAHVAVRTKKNVRQGACQERQGAGQQRQSAAAERRVRAAAAAPILPSGKAAEMRSCAAAKHGHQHGPAAAVRRVRAATAAGQGRAAEHGQAEQGLRRSSPAPSSPSSSFYVSSRRSS